MMRWNAKTETFWKRKFAWFPIRIGDQWIWLERYLYHDNGDSWTAELPQNLADYSRDDVL